MTKYVLPELSYDYGALEPHISGQIMEFHHGKHHRAYVAGANETLEQLADARKKGDFTQIAALERKLAFNVSGHVMHSIFWSNLSPKGGGQPTGDLANAINRDFGGFEQFQKQLTAAASTIMGSGWAALVWEPMSRQLITTQIHDHQSQTAQGGVPLMVIDAWEHAFYLQYKNEKAKFFQALWNVWNWDDIAKRFANAQKLDLSLQKVAEG